MARTQPHAHATTIQVLTFKTRAGTPGPAEHTMLTSTWRDLRGTRQAKRCPRPARSTARRVVKRSSLKTTQPTRREKRTDDGWTETACLEHRRPRPDRTAAPQPSHRALSDPAARPECAAQPRGLGSQPPEARGVSCDTAKTALSTGLTRRSAAALPPA
eukprot:scaffold81363_cov68-Phaeocystis_antarctica.AAC.2